MYMGSYGSRLTGACYGGGLGSGGRGAYCGDGEYGVAKVLYGDLAMVEFQILADPVIQ